MSRDQNRELFPKFAGVIDQLRALYGTDMRVRYVEEGGRTVGRIPEPDAYEIDAEAFARIVANDRRADELNRANPRRSVLKDKR